MTPDDISARLHHLTFGVRRSRRYHLYRQRFFARLDFVAGLLTALSGSVTMASVLAKWGLVSAALAGATALCGAISLAGQTTLRASIHNELAQGFTALERDLALVGEHISEAQLRAFLARRLEIELKEPPTYGVLDSMCHNEEIVSGGYPKGGLIKIGFWQRLLASVVDLNAHRLITNSNKSATNS